MDLLVDKEKLVCAKLLVPALQAPALVLLSKLKAHSALLMAILALKTLATPREFAFTASSPMVLSASSMTMASCHKLARALALLDLNALADSA